MKTKGLSLTLKIFFATVLVVVAIIGTTLFIAARQAGQAADASVNRVLGSAREAVNAQLAGSANGLLEAAEAFAGNANFGALVEAKDPGSALDQAQVADSALGAKWVQITDAEGNRLAKSDEPGAGELNLGEVSPETNQALGRDATEGYGVTSDNELVILAAVPVYRGDRRVVGAMLAARVIDSAFAATVKAKASVTSALDVIFFTSDAEGATVVAASTLGSDAEVVRALSALPVGSDSAETRVETDLRGRHYVGLSEVLRAADQGVIGRFLMLRDRNAEFESYERLQRSLILSAGIGILIAAVLSWLIASQILRPVRKLVEATRRAADGDYKAEIPSTSRDEIGVLAGAFRGLLGDLREKQELVAFLSNAEAAKTVQLNMSATSEQRVAAVGLTPGSKFAARYEVKEILGEGGMGTVFKAVDSELGEVIAIKTLRKDFLSSEPTALERFKSEIRLARRISHRNVVRTHDLGENSGIYYITMEYVEGKSLKELVKSKGRLPLAITLSVGKQLARALEVAHEQGVIHRDIKPQNMVVEPDGVLKVMDFGIARLVTRQPESGVTQAGTAIGTPEYMAPEQFSGKEIDARADIYAAGCVLYECLTGKPPFTADTPYQLVAKLLEDTAPSPRSINRDVPAALDALIMSALAKEPEGRPQSALILHDRLAQIG